MFALPESGQSAIWFPLNYPNGQQTVITNVFGDSPTPNQDGTWTQPNDSVAYQRFDQLNPPLVPPSLPSLPSLPNIKNLLGIGAIIVVVLLLFKK